MKTYFASPERSSEEVIRKEHIRVDGVAYARQIMDAMPCLSVILNNNRQIIYANEALVSLLYFTPPSFVHPLFSIIENLAITKIPIRIDNFDSVSQKNR